MGLRSLGMLLIVLDRSAITERRRMVRRQLSARNIKNRRVLATFIAVPRELFVPQQMRNLAYADQPLPIGLSQTISQPYMVAVMTELARINRRSRVLEVGTGSGYQTAILAKIAKHVWSVERLSDLATTAEKRLRALGIDNVTIVEGDGAGGHTAEAPYDAIVVTAAAADVPQPLLDQLAVGGRLIIPVGPPALQELLAVERTPGGYVTRQTGACRFVPLV